MSIVFALLALQEEPINIVRRPTFPITSAARREKKLLFWDVGEASCAGQVVESVRFDGAVGVPRAIRPKEGATRFLNFAIDKDGRVHSVEETSVKRIYGDADVMPSLAAAQFPAGKPHDNCAVTYTARYQKLDESIPMDLAAMGAVLGSRSMPKETWKVFSENGCDAKPKSRALIRHYPDYRAMEKTPGTPNWSFILFDTDESGAPINVRIGYSSGHKALDKAALDATKKSRVTGANREGCLFTHSLASGTLNAPELPEKWDDPDQPAACDADGRWKKKPNLKYPNSYRRRAIEGWAVFRYDVAPWGEIGNVQVLAAQPTSEFSDGGKRVLGSAEYKAMEQGLTGCIETVRFEMNSDEGEADEAPMAGGSPDIDSPQSNQTSAVQS